MSSRIKKYHAKHDNSHCFKRASARSGGGGYEDVVVGRHPVLFEAGDMEIFKKKGLQVRLRVVQVVMNYLIMFVLERVAGKSGEDGPDASRPPRDQWRSVSSRKGGEESIGLQARYRKIRRGRRYAVVLQL